LKRAHAGQHKRDVIWSSLCVSNTEKNKYWGDHVKRFSHL